MSIRDIEGLFATIVPEMMVVIMELFGIEVTATRRQSEDSSEIYGVFSGEYEPLPGNVPDIRVVSVLITEGYNFVTADDINAGIYDESMMYTVDDIYVGDVLEINRVQPATDLPDTMLRKFIVTERHSLGMTQTIIHRFKLSSLGD